VHFPISYDGRERKIVYVEFTDEDAMNAGLEKCAEVLLFLLFFSSQSSDHASSQKLNDGVVEVIRASERESRDHGGYRGGRGRGHHRGRFVNRGLQSAGLARGGGPKTNGDA
jgi:hypothetical protein